ncbi:MAG: hypothetical protein AAF605_09000 [Myxococcota bacterium]
MKTLEFLPLCEHSEALLRLEQACDRLFANYESGKNVTIHEILQAQAVVQTHRKDLVEIERSEL